MRNETVTRTRWAIQTFNRYKKNWHSRITFGRWGRKKCTKLRAALCTPRARWSIWWDASVFRACSWRWRNALARRRAGKSSDAAAPLLVGIEMDCSWGLLINDYILRERWFLIGLQKRGEKQLKKKLLSSWEGGGSSEQERVREEVAEIRGSLKKRCSTSEQDEQAQRRGGAVKNWTWEGRNKR